MCQRVHPTRARGGTATREAARALSSLSSLSSHRAEDSVLKHERPRATMSQGRRAERVWEKAPRATQLTWLDAHIKTEKENQKNGSLWVGGEAWSGE